LRTTIVSTYKLKSYRSLVILTDVLILIGLIVFVDYLHNTGSHWTSQTVPIMIYLQFHMYYPMFLRLKNVSYDESSIYYNKKSYEVQIPFEDIASIELKSVTGIYGIMLKIPSQGEKEIYFKASVWYPLNFQKKDEIVDELRQAISKYKKTLGTNCSVA